MEGEKFELVPNEPQAVKKEKKETTPWQEVSPEEIDRLEDIFGISPEDRTEEEKREAKEIFSKIPRFKTNKHLATQREFDKKTELNSSPEDETIN